MLYRRVMLERQTKNSWKRIRNRLFFLIGFDAYFCCLFDSYRRTKIWLYRTKHIKISLFLCYTHPVLSLRHNAVTDLGTWCLISFWHNRGLHPVCMIFLWRPSENRWHCAGAEQLSRRTLIRFGCCGAVDLSSCFIMCVQFGSHILIFIFGNRYVYITFCFRGVFKTDIFRLVVLPVILLSKIEPLAGLYTVFNGHIYVYVPIEEHCKVCVEGYRRNRIAWKNFMQCLLLFVCTRKNWDDDDENMLGGLLKRTRTLVALSPFLHL